jgi:hypothetical protein
MAPVYQEAPTDRLSTKIDLFKAAVAEEAAELQRLAQQIDPEIQLDSSG